VNGGAVRNRWPALLAIVLVALGMLAVAVRLDAPSDGSVLRFGGATGAADAVTVDVPGGAAVPGGLRPGDEITAIGGHALADGLGALPAPVLGQVLAYETRAGETRLVTVARADVSALLADGWGDLIFVVALAALAFALYLRRPDEPVTTPLLIAAAGLLGSTITVVAGLSALSLAYPNPQGWLFLLCTTGVYSIGWGAVLVMSLRMVPDVPWVTPRLVRIAYLAPVGVMAAWALVLPLVERNAIVRSQMFVDMQNLVVVAVLLTSLVVAVITYRRHADPVARTRLRWIAGGGLLTIVTGLAFWHLPTVLTGHGLLPAGALGLSGLPFVAGVAVALRRHKLFDIERLANRSLVYAAVVTVLVVVYTATIAVLASALRISDGLAAALAAAVAALVLAPLRTGAQQMVNRLMYGNRDDPAGVLSGLGGRLESVMLPDDVSPTVVETVARSLRVPYVAIDLADGADGFHPVAESGTPAGDVHVEPLTHYGETVGRLRVSGRGVDDPLEAADLALIRSLAQQVGPAVQAVRLHHDLVRSRAEVVALREDERRRLRRELHDGLGPALAAIALKAGLAARDVPAGHARQLLGEITDEVRTSLADVRRVVDALRPPAIDELGLVAAIRARAAALSGDLTIEVSGPDERPLLPAAVETAAYRIAVEAMTNAVRHSGGRHCTVVIEADGAEVVVDVRDDGTGLAADRVPGVGLRSMQERAAELGGQCRIRSGEVGTRVSARLPLEVGVRR
jgi:signal transduction histidine kinase